MKTRKVTVRVICDLPEDVSVFQLKEEIENALKTWAGMRYGFPRFFEDKLFRNSITVKNALNRRSP